MVDISKISGPGSPQDPFSGKDPLKVNVGKFRKHVEETDTEQKKKQKKSQKDIEELEDEAEEAVGARTQASERSPLDIKFPKGPLVKEVEKSDEQQKKQRKRPEEAPPPVKQEEPAPVKTEAFQVEKKEAPSSAVPTKAPKEPTGVEGFVPPPPPAAAPMPIEDKEEEAPIKEELLASPLPAPVEKKGEEKKAQGAKELATPASQTSPGPFFLPPATGSVPGYFSMKPEVFQLFEHMVMAMTVMSESGATETTIHLNSPDFSIFAGAQIVIKEYSTAPKTFNVEFLGNAQNSAVFATSAQDLVAAINSANYNFRINRIESSLLTTERPLFHRKEKPGKKKEKEGDLR